MCEMTIRRVGVTPFIDRRQYAVNWLRWFGHVMRRGDLEARGFGNTF